MAAAVSCSRISIRLAGQWPPRRGCARSRTGVLRFRRTARSSSLTSERNSMPAALICGSIAWDTIMVFKDRFTNHILPDKIHRLNVSFLVPELRREFGGCAGNIAYNLRLLGDVGYPMATVGRDFGPYRDWMAQNGIPADYVRVIETEHTAQGYVTTD